MTRITTLFILAALIPLLFSGVSSVPLAQMNACYCGDPKDMKKGMRPCVPGERVRPNSDKTDVACVDGTEKVVPKETNAL